MGENNKRPVELIVIAAICILALFGMIYTTFQLKHEGTRSSSGSIGSS